MRASFIFKCSKEIFSKEEVSILERYGNQFQQLMDGDRAPMTDAQERFIEVAHGKCEPETIYEKVWWKYIWRLNWEKDPANKAAMGERRRFPDDREDWNRMRGAVWSDIQSRSKGLNE